MDVDQVVIQRATVEDLSDIHEFGLAIPELNVSSQEA